MQIEAEPDADGIALDPVSGHLFVIDGDSGKLTVIDPKSDAVVATIDGGGGFRVRSRPVGTEELHD